MSETMMAKLAAIKAAKETRDREKQKVADEINQAHEEALQEDKSRETEAKKNEVINIAHEQAIDENRLRDAVKEIKDKIDAVNESSQEAKQAVQEAQALLDAGGLEPEEEAAIKEIAQEAEQKMKELGELPKKLKSIEGKIYRLNHDLVSKLERMSEWLKGIDYDKIGEDGAKKALREIYTSLSDRQLNELLTFNVSIFHVSRGYNNRYSAVDVLKHARDVVSTAYKVEKSKPPTPWRFTLEGDPGPEPTVDDLLK